MNALNTPVPGPRDVLRIARRLTLVSLFTACAAIRCQAAAGTASAWGDNNDLQCQIPAGLGSVSALAGGSLHSVALRTNGTVVAWGFNVFGQTNVPAGLTNVISIGAGVSYSLALKDDGTVSVWGGQSNAPPGLTDVTAVAAGWDHCLALKRDGTVVTWGSQSVPVPEPLSNVVAIAAGNGHSLALRNDGTVIAWGDNSSNQTNVPPDLTNVAAIAAGASHDLALKRDGTVVAWGADGDGQTDVPPGLTNVVAIAAGAFHCIVIKGNGTLAGWGNDSYNQVSGSPALSNYVAIAGGAYHTLAIRNNGFPVITVPPASQTAFVSRSATFQVLATGAQPLAFRWQRDGAYIAGATNSVLRLSDIQLSDAGAYAAVVSNIVGSVTSAPAILNPVGELPFITLQPQDTSAICGESASFQAAADGSKPLAYQWQFEGTPIPGATSTSLTLTNLLASQAGGYAMVVTNAFGSVTSAVATLTLVPVTPSITSPLTAAGKQGQPFTYQITALHSPLTFGASGLPPNLTINTTNGIISGIPQESGTFGPLIGAANSCAVDVQTLVLTFASSVPVITSPLTAFGTEATPFSYRITATESPTSFGAGDLPLGLSLNPATGFITGQPVYAGAFDATISASNRWGIGAATLHFSITNAPITGLAIADVTYNYSSPYLLDFHFTLRDSDDPAVARSVVVAPTLLSVSCMEDDVPISPSETAYIVERGTAKLFKSYLVLDFTESIASLTNGDSNGDGISDAVEAMVAGAQDYVNQQKPGSQIGVYEFHREDLDPQQVVPLTTDKTLLDQSIAGIWTNYVQWFPAGSRAWDALVAAITGLGPTNRDEQHFVVFVSDGRDESSWNTVTNVITAATNANVRLYCIGFGAELDTNLLQSITAATSGRYYDAASLGGLTPAFDAVAKDLNGQYLLRWATLRRSTNSFMPSFSVTYQGFTALSPTNPVIVSTNITPPATNPPPPVTNIIIAPYIPTQHTGDVTVGSLRLVANAEIAPRSITLRAAYVPRYIRQLRIHYRANWPCVPSLESTAPGEILAGWSLSETNDGAGGKWLLISSPNPASLATSLPFGILGNLIKFSSRDMLDTTNAFSLFAIDNTIYTNTGHQSFVLENTNSFIAVYPVLPYGTPVPWLIAHGFLNNFAAAELSDPDGDGALTWQEYVANTDPRDPNSRFLVRSLARTISGRYQVTFSTSTNRTYRLESSIDLLNWQTVQDNITGVDADVTVTDTRYLPGTTQLFYRVLVY